MWPSDVNSLQVQSISKNIRTQNYENVLIRFGWIGNSRQRELISYHGILCKEEGTRLS